MRRKFLLLAFLIAPISAWAADPNNEMQTTLLLGQTYLQLEQTRAQLMQQTAMLQGKIDWWEKCASSWVCTLWIAQGARAHR